MDNLELIREGYAAFVRRDIDYLYANVAPDIEWRPAMGVLLAQEVYRGPDEVARVVFEEIPSVLEGYTAEVLELAEVDDETVVAIVRFKGTAVTTGMEIEQVFGQLYTIRDEKIVAMRSFPSKAQALAAVAEKKSA